MDSFIVVNNKNGESCVCSAISKRRGDDVNRKTKRGNVQNITLGDFTIINHIAGNMTEMDLFNCAYTIIGNPAIIVASVCIAGNLYSIFRFHDSFGLCIEVNQKIQIGETEKNIIEEYNRYNLSDKCEYNSKGFCFLLLKLLRIRKSVDEPIKNDLWYGWHYVPDSVCKMLMHAITGIAIHTVSSDKIEEQCKFIDNLSIIPCDSLKHLRISHGIITQLDPIEWNYRCEVRRSDDGIYKRYHGVQQVRQMEFYFGSLCRKCFDKILSICEEKGIKINKIKGSEDEYEFYGSIVSINLDMIKKEEDDCYEPNFILPKW